MLIKCKCGCGLLVEDIRNGRKCSYINGHNKANYSHGGSNTTLYRTWLMMKQRCFTVSYKNFHRYGGRGITLCPEWLDFAKFRTWALANAYKEGLTIDRIDNDGNYEPNNCHFITQSDNSTKDSGTPINQYDKNGKFIATYPSTREAERRLGISNSNISKACNGKYKTVGGFWWRYK